MAACGVLLFSLVISGTVLAHPLNAAPMAPPPVATCPGGCGGATYYGANNSWLQTATDSWPQAELNWCGIADIQAVELYDYIRATGGTGSAPYPTQASIYNLLNSSSAVSPWGRATHGDGGPGPYVAADIAADGGTDPRSMAWGAWDVTPNGYYFHNWIYDDVANQTATNDFSSDFGPHNGVNDPIIVVINKGLHAFVIDGVWAPSDPSANWGSETYIDTWDPWVGYNGTTPYNPYRNWVWSVSDWLGSGSGSPNYLWLYPYWTGNGYDPDPSTATYDYYDPPFPNFGDQRWHWNNYWVAIEQDYDTVCNASPNYALDYQGNFSAYNGYQCGL